MIPFPSLPSESNLCKLIPLFSLFLYDNIRYMESAQNIRIYFKDTIVNEGTISELNIKSIERKDSALYSCRASNAFGSDETSIQLIVQGLFSLFFLFVYYLFSSSNPTFGMRMPLSNRKMKCHVEMLLSTI